MYYKQQETFHQLYIDRCGNKTLIETIAKTKNKLLKKSYTDDPDGKMKEVFYSTNSEHREILKLFKKKSPDELFRYLSETHWRPVYAAYDMFI